MGRSDVAIRRCSQEWVKNNRFQHQDSSGRPRATADRKNRLIFRSAVTASNSSLSTVRRTTRTRMSTMTIHRRLIEQNLRSYRPLRHLPSTPPLFSDESRFQLCPDDYRGRVWRSPGQRADPTFPIARHTDPQPGVIVWGTLSFDSRTPLVVIRAFLQHSGTSTTF
ncbi:HTH_Tnp_Tc3_2 domain-containing protein [Trichonephila clavipes]|nr:HTH_Tnp_Tc3_2 domain-containing protein [Trichonephila clavipes]